MRSVTLAAGRGKRLGALTADRPKPMVEVRGKPILEHIIEGAREAGVDEMLLVVSYLQDVIRDYFGDGSRWGVRLEYVEQTGRHGSGGAMLYGQEFAGEEPFLALYGDILVGPAEYRGLVAEFERGGCEAVIGVNYMADPTAGAAVYREGGRIVRVVEKPPAGTAGSNWNVAGISVYSAAVWPELEAITPSPRGEYELTDAITALIPQGVRAYEIGGFWSDVGTPEALADAERDWPGAAG